MTDYILNYINEGIDRGYGDECIASKLGVDIERVRECRHEREGFIGSIYESPVREPQDASERGEGRQEQRD